LASVGKLAAKTAHRSDIAGVERLRAGEALAVLDGLEQAGATQTVEVGRGVPAQGVEGDGQGVNLVVIGTVGELTAFEGEHIEPRGGARQKDAAPFDHRRDQTGPRYLVT
jgi:hypothetical protein